MFRHRRVAGEEQGLEQDREAVRHDRSRSGPPRYTTEFGPCRRRELVRRRATAKGMIDVSPTSSATWGDLVRGHDEPPCRDDLCGLLSRGADQSRPAVHCKINAGMDDARADHRHYGDGRISHDISAVADEHDLPFVLDHLRCCP